MQKEIVILKRSLKEIGGLEKYAKNIINTFCYKNFKVVLLTVNNEIDFSSNNHLVINKYLNKSFLSLHKISKFNDFCYRYCKKNSSSIILGLDRTSHQTHIRAGDGCHKSYLHQRMQIESRIKKISFFINPLHKKILEIEKEAFTNPILKKLIVNSHMVKNQILSHYNINPNKIFVVHNGVEWELFQEHFDHWQRNKKKFSRKNKLNEENYIFLFIGNDFKRKGLDLILKVLASVKRKDFYLFVLGKDKKIKKYVAFVKKNNLLKNIFFYGQRKDVINFYQVADCLLLPTIYDPFANVTVEALSMGLFVITTKFNGANEVIKKGMGEIIEDNHFESLKNLIEKSFENPKTTKTSEIIRNNVKYLNFNNQLKIFMDLIVE